MSENFDLSGIPLLCDNQSDLDFDSTSELPCTPSKTERCETDINLEETNIFSANGVDDGNCNNSGNFGYNSTQSCSSNILKNEGDVSKVPSSSQGTSNNFDSFTNNNLEKNSSPDGEERKGNIRVRTQEEIILREFDLLDEVGPFDDDKDDASDGGNKYDDDDDDDDDDDEDDDDEDDNDNYLSEEEIDAMLEERLINQPPQKRARMDESSTPDKKSCDVEGNKESEEEKEYTEKEKIVLVEKVKNHFEVLPDGWVTLTHNSGMPLYLHRSTRVCTLSKPYYLGPGSARKHAIPLSAVPCLEYQRAKEEEENRKKNDSEKPTILVVNGTEIPNARVETAQENETSRQLTPSQLTEYCKNLFEFETIQVFRFKSWLARRKFKKQKNEKAQQRPTLPKDTKLITCPIRQSNTYGKSAQTREWIMNPNGKSYVCILHEYVQRALKDQPVYSFKELENTATPYLATVSIGNIQYGTGFGSSKKQAKHDAAKATLEILIPEMKEKIDQDEKLRGHAGNNRGNTDLSFFDGIKIEDPRVTEFCAKTTEPLPYEILLTCLQRNFGLSQMNIKYDTTPLKHYKNEFTMTVGNHTAKVICRNKRDGKQKASQAILQALHPHVPSWGSLLRLYGNTSVKTVKEKKIEEQEITLLQSRSNSHSPNYAILNKLREEMRKFKAMKKAIKPIGKFIPPDDVDLPTESGSDLSNVVL